ncbi:hypothetical protein LAZ40_03160 [Cereibacter sphaeroides]|uniref:hypothetical protein n=1 Tax=Cereibacter sphaeroides TaxID=1063 RepID=UPI001F3864EA|nr:hypothetical protein [Cereibacter sphaeroides]MCE6958054.1 hypothetical protein [Cereibacter sphaeroides]MCE6971353.1 hypothetical protein [Cereibacter sphaeroides]
MIDYNISPFHQDEADVRLADAMLFAALKSALGDRIEPFNSIHDRKGDRPLWGPDPWKNEAAGMRMRRAAYEEPAVVAALGRGKFLPAHEVQAEMDRLAAQGSGAAIRNMVDPANRKRFLPPGSRFDGVNREHIRADGPGFTILVHPYRQACWERRFLVVAGAIVAESPLRFCEEEPAMLLDPQNRLREARDPWRPLEEPDMDRIGLLHAAADALLRDWPLVSGAIDVGMVDGPDGPRAQVTEVTAARPGDVGILFADPVAYARAIAENLFLLEPSLAEDPFPPP